ncbi:hypothetical protein EV560_106148 [Bosea sp. BK604]|nr:hypothetical protein EV560_106148 [Bosea sp. BK604]
MKVRLDGWKASVFIAAFIWTLLSGAFFNVGLALGWVRFF